LTDRQLNTAPHSSCKKTNINRLDNTVKLDIELTNTRLNTTLDRLNERSDKTSDVIYIIFWAAPGNIVIRASLTRNKENTKTSSILDTNGVLAPLTPLIGGTDKFSTNLLGNIIFIAPTMIDSSSENQSHSAFRTRLWLKMQEASEEGSTANTDSQLQSEPNLRGTSRQMLQFLLGLAVEVSCLGDIHIFRDHTIEI
jgi:hypothetical protein